MKTKAATVVFLIFSTGFAMFSMFFGSGNLVFPILLGGEAGEYFFSATSGLLLTGVILPFVGVYAILLYGGRYEQFFARLGKLAAFILPLFILALIGPFGVIPRTITVAHGNLVEIFPNASLIIFSIFFCIATFVLEMDKRRTVTILGAVLTPLLLIALVAIIVYGMMNSGSVEVVGSTTAVKAFSVGILMGYFTVDLLAAFFFAVVVIAHMERSIEGHTSAQVHHQRIIFLAMALGAILLGIIYAGLVYLGTHYAPFLDAQHPERSLAIISILTIGEHAGLVFVTAAVLACLTTAIALTIVSADFLQQRIFRGKINRYLAVLIILVISFIVSTYEFSGIFTFLAPILILVYPALIVLTLFNIAHKLWGTKMIKTPVYLTLVITVYFTYFA